MGGGMTFFIGYLLGLITVPGAIGTFIAYVAYEDEIKRTARRFKLRKLKKHAGAILSLHDMNKVSSYSQAESIFPGIKDPSDVDWLLDGVAIRDYWQDVWRVIGK